MFRQQFGGVVQATTDAAVGVMQEDQVPALSDLRTTDPRNGAQDGHGFQQRRVDPATDVADHRGLTGLELKNIHRVDSGVDATNDHGFARRDNLQVGRKTRICKRGIALGKGL
ncbi:hypothetical protein D3C71_807330 [compost metagenome]